MALPVQFALAANVHMSLADLRQWIVDRHLVPQCEGKYHFTIDGFGHDPRSLGDIPEVVEFCKLVVQSGMLSILHTSTCLPFVDEDIKMFGGFGALEVWLVSKDMFKGNTTKLTAEHMDAFEQALRQSNYAHHKLISERCN